MKEVCQFGLSLKQMCELLCYIKTDCKQQNVSTSVFCHLQLSVKMYGIKLRALHMYCVHILLGL